MRTDRRTETRSFRHRICRWAFGGMVLWASLANAEVGTIRGQIADERGQITYTGNVVVFICDAESGFPFLGKTKKLFPNEEQIKGLKDLWHAETTDEGVFEFQEVPVGKYRLVAQSWSGTKGVPDFQQKPSTIVILNGVAEGVEVKANETIIVNPRKLGDGMLKIVNDPEEAHAFLLISQKPRLGEGVLGPAAWGPEFISGLIGVTQMEKGYVTLIGLPEGKEIHTGLINFDNNPGVGGDSYVVGKDKEVRLEIYATWSNGKYEPPARLAKLTDHLEEQKLSVSKLLGLEGSDHDNREALLRILREKSDQKIVVEGVGTFRLADVLAASKYQALRKSHRARMKR